MKNEFLYREEVRAANSDFVSDGGEWVVHGQPSYVVSGGSIPPSSTFVLHRGANGPEVPRRSPKLSRDGFDSHALH